MKGISGVSAAVCLALLSDVGAAAPKNPDIAGLVSRLGDDSFPERERASEEILARARKQSKEIETALVEAYRHSPEPEIRFRCKNILMRFYSESVGYVGVHYQNREFFDKQGERHLVVGIFQIAPSSPAAKAGLQPGDVILAVNGQPVDPVQPDRDFKKRVQMLGVGRPMILKLSRGMEELDVKITLARSPIRLTDKEAETLFKARLQKAEQEAAAK